MDEQNASTKPATISNAVHAMWASLAVGVIKTAMDFSHLSAMASMSFLIIVWFFTFGLIAFLIAKVSVGRNWARITLAVLLVIGVLPTVLIVLGEFSRSPFVGVLSIVQAGLQVYALVLVFTKPGSAWFQKV